MVWEATGRDMVRAMVGVLQLAELINTDSRSAHDRECLLSSSESDRFRTNGGFDLWAAGILCVDCSSIGVNQSWSGDGCIVVMIWLFHAVA